MSESIERARSLAKALDLAVADERLEKLALSFEQALAETDAVRGESTPWPAPSAFDASWSEKK